LLQYYQPRNHKLITQFLRDQECRDLLGKIDRLAHLKRRATRRSGQKT
jgi:hypothetical protein